VISSGAARFFVKLTASPESKKHKSSYVSCSQFLSWSRRWSIWRKCSHSLTPLHDPEDRKQTSSPSYDLVWPADFMRRAQSEGAKGVEDPKTPPKEVRTDSCPVTCDMTVPMCHKVRSRGRCDTTTASHLEFPASTMGELAIGMQPLYPPSSTMQLLTCLRMYLETTITLLLAHLRQHTQFSGSPAKISRSDRSRRSPGPRSL
jgi:hypothetical protein